jgi:hypothetical protein
LCRLPELNWGPNDFQSFALPTELKRRNDLLYTLFQLALSTVFVKLMVQANLEQAVEYLLQSSDDG